MAGAKIGDVIDFVVRTILQRSLSDVFRGFVYYSNESEEWIVYEIENRRKVPLVRSSYKEAECFVYFDESRCRGSDMKLPATAGAVVTLDSRLTKDKFLQGCARMRRLGQSRQWLVLAGTEETISKRATPKSVFEAILKSTVLAIQSGLSTYFQRAKDFQRFPEALDDNIDLESLYSGHLTEFDDFRDYLDHHYQKETGEILEVTKYCRSIGGGVKVQVSTIGQECEKEIEAENEEENEEEVQLERKQPYSQVNWGYSEVFVNPAPLFQNIFVPLETLVKNKCKVIAGIHWSKKVFCSPNFFKTTSSYEEQSNMSLYLRPVSHLIVFQDGRVVLVSTHEMNELLPHWWKWMKKGSVAALSNLYLLEKGGNQLAGGSPKTDVSVGVMTTLKLFRGYVTFTPQEKVVLAHMLRDLDKPYDTVQDLLSFRGRLGYFQQSDLDEVSYNAAELAASSKCDISL
eukprot:scaffold39593_cov176-Amphora_coffeaeformis.AAC.2